MIDLKEVKQRALSELQEAGEEEFTTLLNTIFEASGKGEELESLRDALKELVNEGYALIIVPNSDKKRDYLWRGRINLSNRSNYRIYSL